MEFINFVKAITKQVSADNVDQFVQLMANILEFADKIEEHKIEQMMSS